MSTREVPPYTAAPWEVHQAETSNPRDYIIKHFGQGLTSHICRIYDTALCPEHGTTLENAMLIASAPQLAADYQGAISKLVDSENLVYELLEQLKNDHEVWIIDSPSHNSRTCQTCKIIEKTEGRS